MRQHHSLDPYPIPQEEHPLFINEPWLIDGSIIREIEVNNEPEAESDNRRVYVPLDLNKSAILRRLSDIMRRYGAVNWRNEMDFSVDVERLLAQVDIYDQIWYIRHTPTTGVHSSEAIELMHEFIKQLERIPDGGAECFPFELIDRLKKEYL